MKRALLLTLALCLVAGAVQADGPETGVVTGTVRGPGSDPVPGVGVTISGERGEKFTQTDTEGLYRFALLVPGPYELNASLEGLGTAVGSLVVVAGKRVTIDLQLVLATSDTITVTSEAPLVDKFSIAAGQTMQSDVGVEVTGENRSYYGIINFMPGVSNEDENADLASTRPNINGASWADSTVYIDGVDTTFSRYGGSRVFLPSAATVEVSLESGGLSADYGRTVGSATNVIVKSGTNKFHGDFLYSRTQEDWNGEFDSRPELLDRQFCRGQSLLTNTALNCDSSFFKRTAIEKDATDDQFETGVGGPIKRDKAWFFVSANRQNSNQTGKTQNGDAVDESGTTESRIVKLNLQAGASHSIAFNAIDTPVFRNFRLEPVFDRYAMTPHDLSGELYSASYNWSASDTMFVEAKVASQTSNENKLLAFGGLDIDEAIRIKQMDPRFPGADPALVGPDFPGNNFRPYLDSDGWHNGWLLDNGYGTNKYPREQVNLALTQFAGQNHELKYGFDAQQVEWNGDVRRENLYSGQGTNIFSSTAVSGFVNPFSLNPFGVPCDFTTGSSCIINDYNADFLLDDLGTNDTHSENTAVYIRDRWSSGRFVVNAGVRVEKQLHENDVNREVMNSTDVSPRISAAWDTRGDGRELVTIFVGRAFHQLPQQAINEYMQDQYNAYNGYQRRLFLDCAFVDCTPFPGFRFPLPLGYTFDLGRIQPGFQWDLVDAGVFQSNLEPYHKDEVIVGYERQVGDNWVFDAKLLWWEVDNLISSTTQLGFLDGRIDVWTLTANTSDIPDIMRAVVGAAAGQFVVAGGVPLPAAFFLANEAAISQYVEPYRDYRAIQLQMNKRFSNNWGMYSNLTFADSGGSSHGSVFNNTNDSYGENLDQVMTVQDITNCQNRQPNRTNPVDCWAAWGPHLGTPLSLINRDGSPPFDRSVIAKATGWKLFKINEKQTFTLGGSATWNTGSKWHRSEGAGGSAINPLLGGIPLALGVGVPITETGSEELDSYWWVNLSGAFDFPIGRSLTGEVRLEIQNITDNQDQTGITGLGEPRPLRRAFQRPRRFRVLASLAF